MDADPTANVDPTVSVDPTANALALLLRSNPNVHAPSADKIANVDPSAPANLNDLIPFHHNLTPQFD